MKRLAPLQLPRREHWLSYAWALPALIFLLLALGSLGPSSFFLHFDTPTQDTLAADLLDACLGTAGGKPAPVFILWLAFALGGVNPLWETVILTGWSVIAFYSLRVALGNTFLTPRMFAGAYPPLAVTAVFTASRLTGRLSERLTPAAKKIGRAAAWGIVALALPLATLHHTLDVAVAPRTAYDVIDRTIAEAAASGLPVRYFGNLHVAEFFGLRHNAEVAINETSPGIITGDTRAVLIFEGQPGAEHPTLAALRAGGQIDPAQYAISTYPHFTRYQPASAENYGLSPAALRSLRSLSFAREQGAAVAQAAIWRPRNPSGTFMARQATNFETGEYIIYYPGNGCLAGKRYGRGDKNYYEILWERARPIGEALAAGEFGEAWRMVKSRLADG